VFSSTLSIFYESKNIIRFYSQTSYYHIYRCTYSNNKSNIFVTYTNNECYTVILFLYINVFLQRIVIGNIRGIAYTSCNFIKQMTFYYT